MAQQGPFIYRWLHMPSGKLGLVFNCKETAASLPDHILFVEWHSLVMPEPKQVLTCSLLPANQFRKVAVAPEEPVTHSTPRHVEP